MRAADIFRPVGVGFPQRAVEPGKFAVWYEKHTEKGGMYL